MDRAELSVAEVRRLMGVALLPPERPPELRLAWSDWRCKKRCQARLSHARRRCCNEMRL